MFGSATSKFGSGSEWAERTMELGLTTVDLQGCSTRAEPILCLLR